MSRSFGGFSFREFVPVLQLYANVLCEFTRDLTAYQISAAKFQAGAQLAPNDKKMLQAVLESCSDATSFLYLPATKARHDRFVATIEAGCAYSEVTLQLRMLRETFEDELRSLLVMYMPPGQAVY